VLPDKDQDQTAPQAAPIDEQSEFSQPAQSTLQNPIGEVNAPTFNTPISAQEPENPSIGQAGSDLSSVGNPLSLEPTPSGPTFSPTSPPPPPSPTLGPVVGGTIKPSGNKMQKIKLFLILIPIIVFLVIILFAATFFLGKARSKNVAQIKPTPSVNTQKLPTLPPINPGGFGQISTPTPTFDSSGNIYRDSTYGFSIEPPVGWIQEKGIDYLTFKNPQEDIGPSGNKFYANLSIGIKTMSANENFDSYVALIKSNLSTYSGYKEISEVKGVLGGQPAFQIDFTWDAGMEKQRKRIIILQKNQNIFSLTAASTIETWDKYQPIFEKSITTFTFTNPSF